MLVLTSVIVIVFGVLQIILFFKIWGMTDNVKRLTEHFCNDDAATPGTARQEKTQPVKKDYDKRLDTVKPGDHVIRITDGKEMKVDDVSTDALFCKGGMEGYKWYPKPELRLE